MNATIKNIELRMSEKFLELKELEAEKLKVIDKELFPQFEDNRDLHYALKALDSGDFNHYEIDSCNLLVGMVNTEFFNHLESYQLDSLKRYLETIDSGFFLGTDNMLSICLGDFYCISDRSVFDSARNVEFFTFDRDTANEVIFYEIERYQQLQGEYPYIVKQDRYGNVENVTYDLPKLKNLRIYMCINCDHQQLERGDCTLCDCKTDARETLKELDTCKQ